jgi:long-chain acyl-CoA synthetase
LTCELASKFEDMFGLRIVHGYGLSETTCYSCYIPIDLSPEEHKKWQKDFGSRLLVLQSNRMRWIFKMIKANLSPEGMRGEIQSEGIML